ncbi:MULTISPECIES: hypothetical protein [Bacillus]|uniref:ABC transporter permease n=1 Tax=Bacillus paranthracis TaxID=2026186 RepID=A0AAX3QL96_9BACI|nr:MULTISPECIES: hypothetical protein [Bacillus cereus group]ASZ17728.1 hypothetical protein CK938_14530 [Bacillus cereus]MBE7117780.1 hypothetical protein [Bacillus paranthracis]MBE7135196.1 hypothetical protein [Bacillus paranthracis]MBE7155746.1 hypothetical protein [Bacillus paranthracis]MBL3757580.1 hypothetical protein [Bacillus cereus]
MSYYYCEYCKDYKKKYHNCCKRSEKSNDCKEGYHHKAQTVNVNVECCNEVKKDPSVRQSAFKAVGDPILITPQVPAFTFTRIVFPIEQFDLANEYNNTDTFQFVPKTDGVYSFTTTVFFNPAIPDVNYTVAVYFIVNGTEGGVDSEFTGVNAIREVAVESNNIFQLKAGDTVEVYALATVDGNFPQNSRVQFGAARFPSPAE